MTGLRHAEPAQDRRGAAVPAGVLIDHPFQHIAPGLRALARQAGLRVRVYYWRSATEGGLDAGFGRHVQWQADLHSGYDWWSPPATLAGGRRRLAVLGQLRRDRPRVLLSFGWRSPVARLGIGYAHATGVPLLYYGDSHPGYSVSGGRGRLRRWVLRTLFRAAAGAVATGPANRQFYLEHGLDDQRIHPGVLPADVHLFAAAAQRHRPAVPAAAGQDRPLVIGCAGKFIAQKAVGDLIAAAARLPAAPPWRLWLIGDGPLRAELTALVARYRLTDRVDFLGFRNLDELPALFAAVDIMVAPSHKDHRPLAVLEAMAAGSAVLVSSATGLWGPGDIVQPDDTGLVFPVADIDALAGCLRRLLTDAGLRTRLAASGQARAGLLGPETFARTTAAALLTAAEARSASGS